MRLRQLVLDLDSLPVDRSVCPRLSQSALLIASDLYFAAVLVEQREQRSCLRVEASAFAGGNRPCFRQRHRPRILVHAVHEKFVMEVRRRGPTRSAYITDHLALPHLRATPYPTTEFGKVQVFGLDVIAVLKDHEVAVGFRYALPC